MSKIGYSYIRFSTPEQAEGDSLRRQTEKTVAWCKTNGVTLDTSLKLQDLGVSGFSGAHRDNPDKFGLAAFLQLVRDGKIAPDSYLIVENLDRLTREHLRPAVRFVLELLDEHRINIVTTSPERMFRHDSNDMVDIIIAVVELSRGHGESQRKSEIVGAAWREKKADAVKNKTVLSAMCPHWLEVVDGEYREIPDRVKLVQRMYEMIVTGTGIGAMMRILNREGSKPWQKVRKKTDIGKPHIWQKSSIARILDNRAVVGEYQPHVGNKVRKPVGEPVGNYYPVIVTEEQFWAAQAAMSGRKRTGGRERTKGVNLFTSLVKDAKGHNWVIDNKGGGKLFLANVTGAMVGEAYSAIPYSAFEHAVLLTLSEIDPAELLPKEQRGQEAARLTEVQTRLDATKEKVRVFEERMFEDFKNTTWPVLLDRAKLELAGVLTEYQEARRAVATPLVGTMGEVRTLIDVLKRDPSEETRRRLRARIACVISEITISVAKAGVWRNATVVIRFKHPVQNLVAKEPCGPFTNVGYQRVVMFNHRPARRGRGYETPEETVLLPVLEVSDEHPVEVVNVDVKPKKKQKVTS